MKKYELLENDTIRYRGATLYRIRALRDFGDVKAGDIGGYVEAEHNLSHAGLCWVTDYGRVTGHGLVTDKGRVTGHGRVTGNGEVTGHGEVTWNGLVASATDILIHDRINDEHPISNYFRNSSGGITIKIGCWTGTIEELKPRIEERKKEGANYLKGSYKIYKKQYEQAVKKILGEENE